MHGPLTASKNRARRTCLVVSGVTLPVSASPASSIRTSPRRLRGCSAKSAMGLAKPMQRRLTGTGSPPGRRPRRAGAATPAGRTQTSTTPKSQEGSIKPPALSDRRGKASSLPPLPSWTSAPSTKAHPHARQSPCRITAPARWSSPIYAPTERAPRVCSGSTPWPPAKKHRLPSFSTPQVFPVHSVRQQQWAPKVRTRGSWK